MKKVQNFAETIKIPLHYWKSKDYYLYITLPKLSEELNIEWCDFIEYLICDKIKLLNSNLDIINETYSIWIFSFKNKPEDSKFPKHAYYDNMIQRRKNDLEEIIIQIDLNRILNIDKCTEKYSKLIEDFFVEIEFPKIEKLVYSKNTDETATTFDSADSIEFWLETN